MHDWLVAYHPFGLEREFKFHPHRRWRFDFAYPELKLAIEVEGGTFSRPVITTDPKTGKPKAIIVGRHSTGKGLENDAEKYGEAAILGWAVIRVPTSMIKTGKGFDLIDRAYQARAHPPESNTLPLQSL